MLRLLSLTVVAQAPGGPSLPTHQAGVGGDVCPLRVCREAEDTHYCTVKVPHGSQLLARCRAPPVPPQRAPGGAVCSSAHQRGEAGPLDALPPPRFRERAAPMPLPSNLLPLPLAIHRHNCTLWLRSGQERRACTRSYQLYAEGESVGDGGQPRRKCGVCGVSPDVHILPRRRATPQPSQADRLVSPEGGASGYPNYPPFPPRTVVACVLLVEPSPPNRLAP